MESWLDVSPDSPFSLVNLPLSVYNVKQADAKYSSGQREVNRNVCTRLGDFVIDLRQLARDNAFDKIDNGLWPWERILSGGNVNPLINLGLRAYRLLRQHLQHLLRKDTNLASELRDNAKRRAMILPLSQVELLLPVDIGDYTDFYTGKNHAFNAGVLLRGPENALQPNYMHMPIAYHGRSSTVVVSETPIRRPSGQILEDPAVKIPMFSPTRKLDFELEMGMIVCSQDADDGPEEDPQVSRNLATANRLGEPISVDEAGRYIFGYVLLNDWSARDIQAWEYVPLGPFGGKNFATTISPYIVFADALEPFRTQGLEPGHSDKLLPYLRHNQEKAMFDIDLRIDIEIGGRRHAISRTNASNVLYSWEQMLAHHTVTGCSMRSGDLLGSGTISGTEKDSLGSLMEMTENGKKALNITEGVNRTYLEDGDGVIFTGIAGKRGAFVGFGECKGKIFSAELPRSARTSSKAEERV